MNILNNIFGRVEHLIYQPWFNPLATLYVNFRLCNFLDAVKFPIYIYGYPYFDLLNGSVQFNSKVTSGMVKFGQNIGHFSSPKGKAYFFIEEKSILVFDEKCTFTLDTSLRLMKNCKVVFGKDVVIGDSVKILCENYIEIGEKTRIAYGSQIVDTNFHYIKDIENNMIQRKNCPIKIGSYNWIGNYSKIMKGCETSDWNIIASGSLVNKKFQENNIIIAGSPAKVVAKNKQRIFSTELELDLDLYFKRNELCNEYSE
ncbi:MAG: acyltransferase [Paludibacter sp.]|nr:acyltransferase [Paludibacter sp.]